MVDEFNSTHPLEIVGVHCTHGFNRTGFFICSYLVEKYDYDIAAAIQVFATARPPGIYKRDYIVELFMRYGDEEDEPLQAPNLPEWCYDEEETDDQYDTNQQSIQMPTLPSSHPMNNSSNSSSPSVTRKRKIETEIEGNKINELCNIDSDEVQNDRDCEASTSNSQYRSSIKKRKAENLRLDATFMKGVGGVSLMTNKIKVNALQHMIQDMCEWKGTGFPGCQPVSMDRINIKLLHTKPYKVSWKADGTRYMMLIKDKDEIYFFDRDNSCFKVSNLTFFKRDLVNHLKNTLIDGEMVIDVDRGNHIPRYLVYDIITLEDQNVGKKSFTERLQTIKLHIIEPRHQAMFKCIIRKESEPFSVRLKDFWDVTAAHSLLGEKFAKQLSHEPDGLIFQPKLEPYVCGRCDEVLKWKPCDQNSVDFQLRIVCETGIGIVTRKRAFLYVGGQTSAFAEMKYTTSLKDFDKKIIECKFDNNQWIFMRERTDKSYPNALSTAIGKFISLKKFFY